MHSCGRYFLAVCVIYFAVEKCSSEYIRDIHLNTLESSLKANTGDNFGYNYKQTSNNNFKPEYGSQTAVYGPLTYHKPVGIYNSGEHWIFEKLRNKINLFVIGNTILKWLIFKKIVKFIGVICLLLFLPKTKDFLNDDMPVDEGDSTKRRIILEKDILEIHISELQTLISGLTASNDSN